MKKQLLFIASLIVGLTSQAQCTITPTCTPSSTSGYCTQPIGGAQLPSAMVGSPYSTTIQVSVATTALDGAVQLMGVTINGSTLPAGLGYSTNPAGGTISGGSNACIEISGTPTTEWMGFNVSFDVTAMTDQGNVNQTLNYTMNVDASTASLLETSEKTFALFPNPANSNVQISVNKPTTLIISDVLGNIIQEVQVNSSISLPVINWKNGLYFVTSEESGETMKFIKR